MFCKVNGSDSGKPEIGPQNRSMEGYGEMEYGEKLIAWNTASYRQDTQLREYVGFPGHDFESVCRVPWHAYFLLKRIIFSFELSVSK